MKVVYLTYLSASRQLCIVMCIGYTMKLRFFFYGTIKLEVSAFIFWSAYSIFSSVLH